MTSKDRVRKHRYLRALLNHSSSSLDSQSGQSQIEKEENDILHIDETVSGAEVPISLSPETVDQHQISNEGETQMSFVASETSTADDDHISMIEMTDSETDNSTLSENEQFESEDVLEPNFIEIDNNDRFDLEHGLLEGKLRNWSHKHIRCVTAGSISDMLLVWRSEGFVTLPKCGKTLLNTNKAEYDITFMENDKGTFGEYCYFGIETALREQLIVGEFTDKKVKLLLHEDGVELYNKTSRSANCILGLVFNSGYDAKPFLIGLYYGQGKPKSPNEFLNDLVEELNNLNINGLTIQENTFAVEVSAFVCDTLARAYIKVIKSHTAYYACERCEVHGVHIDGKLVFSDIDAPERTHESFRDRTQPDHYSSQETSPLLRIIGLNIIKSVVLDPMHLLYCGVAKTLLHKTMISGKVCDYRLSDRQVSFLQDMLKIISDDVPEEFQRKTFDLADTANWKATQYRFWLLYASGLVLEDVLPQNAYKHFMLLFTAVRILSSDEIAVQNAEVAKNLLRTFVKLMPTYCRTASQLINFHNLIHLADDVVYLKCSLEHFSAFVFENVYSFLKPLLKSVTKPIAQIARRVHELKNKPSESIKKRYPLVGSVRQQRYIPFVKTQEETESKRIFKIVKLNGMTLRSTHPNNVCILNDGNIIRIVEMFIKLDNGTPSGDIIVRAKKINVLGDAFDYPISSQLIGIYHVSTQSRRCRDYELNTVKTKCILTSVDEKYFVIELLHDP